MRLVIVSEETNEWIDCIENFDEYDLSNRQEREEVLLAVHRSVRDLIRRQMEQERKMDRIRNNFVKMAERREEKKEKPNEIR